MNVITILCDTLRRDHCSAYTDGKPLNECWSKEQPDWIVPTPNMNRLAARGTTFDNCWCGSTPCMPARRDIYTGRYEFLERGWGPLEETDLDLPRQISGEPNRSLEVMRESGDNISYLITDHFHLWEQGSGNYHMGYSGFDFVRGIESDGLYTDPVDFFCPPVDRKHKLERYWRNVHFIGRDENNSFPAQIFVRASNWVERNKSHKDFYLHLDCFSPHEPFAPPENILKQFWPDGYDVDFDWNGAAPYAKWQDSMTDEQLRFAQARYAANVANVDKQLGILLDKLDEHNLWDDTLVIFTTDHGTYNGDHGRTGKLQTHEHDAVGHIPLIMCHPKLAHGQRRQQLVQLVDLYPTTLAAIGKPIPNNTGILHGVNLLPVLEDGNTKTRDFAIAGQFGKSITLTDGNWILHQSPKDSSAKGNQPLYWYSHYLSPFAKHKLGDYQCIDKDQQQLGREGKRPVIDQPSWPAPTWLSDKQKDPNELKNIAKENPKKLKELQRALVQKLDELGAPKEQKVRLGLENK